MFFLAFDASSEIIKKLNIFDFGVFWIAYWLQNSCGHVLPMQDGKKN